MQGRRAASRGKRAAVNSTLIHSHAAEASIPEIATGQRTASPLQAGEIGRCHLRPGRVDVQEQCLPGLQTVQIGAGEIDVFDPGAVERTPARFAPRRLSGCASAGPRICHPSKSAPPAGRVSDPVPADSSSVRPASNEKRLLPRQAVAGEDRI